MMGKTNAIRLVEQGRIPYREAFYPFDESDLSGLHAAESIGLPPEQVFKTLVAGESGPALPCSAFPYVASWTSKKRPGPPETKRWSWSMSRSFLA